MATPSEPILPRGWDCHVHVFDDTAAPRGAHYAPVRRPLPDIEALALANGCGHLVLVQPSVYGPDNTLLLQALRAAQQRHRGVVVVRGDEDADELADMHAAGVRGVRFNLVSPVGSARAEAEAQLLQLAPKFDALGWHVQWYVQPGDLPQLVAWQGETELTFVFDHLAGLTPAHMADEIAWDSLAQLAGAGCWIKLSGWYRLQAQPPYGALQPLIRRVVALFGERVVWGSDWPHTSFQPGAAPAYDSLWCPVVRSLGEEAAHQVRLAGWGLYS